MKQIKLTQGKYALVDDQDYKWLNQWNWCVNSNNYVMRVKTIKKKRETITLHRLIMNAPKGMQVDHKNANRLDNQRDNLRLATHSQNCSYRKSSTKPASGYRGVTKYQKKNELKWIARIEVNGRKKYLGIYNTPELAAKVYDTYAEALYGKFSVLNFPYMHREIMGNPKKDIDHMNNNKLDNRKQNLRLCSPSQNGSNMKIPKSNKSGFKGVSWNKQHKKWSAYIYKNYKHIFIGSFEDKQEAALAYNKAATVYFGEFARINIF